MEQTCKIVVVGAGFGGLTFCQHFHDPRAHITVVDRTNHHLFQPLLYQVAMAGLSAPDIAQPIRSILSRRPNLEVLLDEVQDFDLHARRVICRHNSLDYDYLLLAFGSVTSYFGNTDWTQYAPGMKTLDDALQIRSQVLLAFEKAESQRMSPAERARLMTLVIVGGGPTGVELAGACAELAHHVLRRDFDHIDPACARIILIEGDARILGQFPPDLSAKAQRRLEKLGVTVLTSHRVKAVTQHALTLANGEVIEAENILWAAGVMAHPLTKKLGVELDRAGRIKVTPQLTLPGHPEVFAIGDIVALNKPDGSPVPGVAPAAMQMAKYAARALEKALNSPRRELPAQPFCYRDKGSLATIGRSAGIAHFGKIRFNGFFAWLAWLMVHLIFLIGFRNKLAVFIAWTYSYFTYKSGARIITEYPEKPLLATTAAPAAPEPHFESATTESR